MVSWLVVVLKANLAISKVEGPNVKHWKTRKGWILLLTSYDRELKEEQGKLRALVLK